MSWFGGNRKHFDTVQKKQTNYNNERISYITNTLNPHAANFAFGIVELVAGSSRGREVTILFNTENENTPAFAQSLASVPKYNEIFQNDAMDADEFNGIINFVTEQFKKQGYPAVTNNGDGLTIRWPQPEDPPVAQDEEEATTTNE